MRKVVAQNNNQVRMILVDFKRDTPPHMTTCDSHIPPRFSSISTEADFGDRIQRQRERLMGLYRLQRETTLMIVSIAAGEDARDCIHGSG